MHILGDMENSTFENKEKNQNAKRPHKLTLDNHRLLSVSGIKSVPTFTDKGISIELDAERLDVIGRDLSVKNLDVEAGTLTVDGYVTALKYGGKGSGGSIIGKLLK